MSIIPLHTQRRFEQRWVLQFGSLIPDVSKNGSKGSLVKAKENPPDCVGGHLFLRLVEWNQTWIWQAGFLDRRE